MALLPIYCSVALAQESTQEKWYHKLGKWVEGEPWSWEGNLPMTHTKYLFHIGEMGVKDQYLSPIAHRGMEGKLSFPVSYTHLDVYKRQPYSLSLIIG